MITIFRAGLVAAALSISLSATGALAYAAPSGRKAVDAPAASSATSDGTVTPTVRRTCPMRSWPNLAPRCTADAGQLLQVRS